MRCSMRIVHCFYFKILFEFKGERKMSKGEKCSNQEITLEEMQKVVGIRGIKLSELPQCNIKVSEVNGCCNMLRSCGGDRYE